MMRFGPNSWARKVWYRKRKTQKCHLRFCGTVNKKGHSFRKGGAPQVVKTEIRLWYFCGQTRNRRGINHGDFHFGGPDRIRTDDPYNANVVRSQLRYRPKQLLHYTRYFENVKRKFAMTGKHSENWDCETGKSIVQYHLASVPAPARSKAALVGEIAVPCTRNPLQRG